MVYLSRIYTKTGDQGETALGDGQRVPKNHPRVSAYGSVDELNSVLGLLLAHHPNAAETDFLRSIQNDLFDVGADLCIPHKPDEPEGQSLRVQTEQVERLEKAIDRLNEDLPPLTSFVVPGGKPPAAWCHLARTVCRRAERDVVTLTQTEAINPQAVIYLNRLSDFLFVLGRIFDESKNREKLWEPGKTQKKQKPTRSRLRREKKK